MAQPADTEERLRSLEARLTAVEQLRQEMRTGHVMIVTALTEQIEESRRYSRVLHEDVLGRFRVIAEILAAQSEKLAIHDTKFASLDERLVSHENRFASLDEKVASQGERITTLSATIEAARGETRLRFEQVLAHLDATRTPPKRKRR